MIIFIKPDGTGKGRAEIVTPEVIYQGSNNVTNIVVMAPYAPQTSMEIGFILPDGLYWNAPTVSGKSGGRYAPMSFVEQNMMNKVGVWEYALPASVTSMFGKVQIAINAITRINTGGTTTVEKSNCTSYLCEFTVQESVVPDLPANPPDDVYTLLRQYLSALDGRTANVPNLVAGIQKSGGNSFTFTDNTGFTSEPITLGEIDYNPTYIGAASVIDIPITAWQPNSSTDPTGYTVTITAAIHGQMLDGVSAHDLWISFDKTQDGAIEGAYQGYTVNAAGNITLNATTPIGMTLRIWNGKGLVDMVARGDIAAETARAEAVEAQLQRNIDTETSRAEAAETNLQSQIDEITQSGVDLTARAHIEAEVARAEAAETALSGRVEQNTTGLSSVQSDVNTLSEDVYDVQSVIPDTASTSNELADKAFVNSSLNSLAAFAIYYNAAGDAFPTRASLFSATTFYNANGQTRVPTQNDYATVLQDESQTQNPDGTYPTARYTYQDGTYPNGQWGFWSVVNSTPFTQAQVDAINSGITEELVNEISKGSVTSVNGETGAVTITPENIGALNKAGDTATGKINFAGGAAFPSSAAIAEKDELPYFLGMTPFADGGNICWARVDNTKKWLGINEKVSKSGDRVMGPLTVKPTSGRALLEVISEQNVPCDIYMGANDKKMFSWTARAENNTENLRFGLYDLVKVRYAIKLTDDDELHFYYPIYDGESRVYSANNPQPPLYSSTNMNIPSNVNLNNYTTPGTYTSTNSSNSITNKPPVSNSAGKLIVYTTTHNVSYVNQEWQCVGSTDRWVRSSNADSGTRVWSEWKYITTDGYSPNNPPPEALSTVRGTVYGKADNSNTALGYGSSIYTAGGSATLTNSMALGKDASVHLSGQTGSYTNNTAIGYGAAVVQASNTIQMGNSSISSFKCKVSVTTTSDERDKGDIVDIDTDLALRFVTQVEPIHYVDNDRHKYLKLKKKIDSETGEETYDDSDENTKLYLQYGMCEYDRESHARGDKKGRRGRIGVKAQQVQQALLDIFGSDNYANLVNDDYYDLREEGNEPPVENHLSVSYERFVPFLIAAIQAQQKQIDELKELVKGKV